MSITMRFRHACQQTKLPVSALPAASQCLTAFSRHRSAAIDAQTAALAIPPFRMLCVPRFDHPGIDACFCVCPQVRGPGAGLASAAFVGIVPSYISRSVAGSYDNEGVAIFALMFVFFFYVKVRAHDAAAS